MRHRPFEIPPPPQFARSCNQSADNCAKLSQTVVSAAAYSASVESRYFCKENMGSAKTHRENRGKKKLANTRGPIMDSLVRLMHIL